MSDVLVSHSDSHPVQLDLFRKKLEGYNVDEVRLEPGGLKSESGPTPLEEKIPRYRGLYIRTGHITRDVIQAATNLEIISTAGSGYNHIDIEAATKEDILVTHSPESPAPGVIEHTFGLIFSLTHRLPWMFAQTADGNWSSTRTELKELKSRTIGVVGLGTIGFEVAQIARSAFDAEVLAYDPYVMEEKSSNVYPKYDSDTIANAGIELVSMRELFDRADIVTLHCPLTSETEHMIGEAELNRLTGGYLINTARGGVIDHDALVKSVQKNQLAGIALDVFNTEPPKEDDVLLNASDVLVTPHVAGWTDGYLERSAINNAEKITKALHGKRPSGLLNPQVLG